MTKNTPDPQPVNLEAELAKANEPHPAANDDLGSRSEVDVELAASDVADALHDAGFDSVDTDRHAVSFRYQADGPKYVFFIRSAG